MADNNYFGWLSGNDSALVAPHLEYYRKNRWVLDFKGLPAGITAGGAQSLRLNAYKAALPEREFEDVKVERMNGRINLPGKPTYAEWPVSFYDSIRTTGTNVPNFLDDLPSPSEVLEEWMELISQPNLGDAFGSVAMFKGFALLHKLAPLNLSPNDPDGNGPDLTFGDPAFSPDQAIAQTWLIQGLYPKKLSPGGELNYGENEVQDVTVTFKYDRAFRVKAATAISA